ncbi:potassium-transporting ATPase subunit C [Gordonia sp. X0973]|uniref:potassium-transporting ATPase subunit C n=1 Tax=Gordonia sp. X0973 TaxID=2742602 RepID=UPI000F54341E|nr:potassium-transporting ATPase subunit C [Gordonia sp. X0973]QKT08578.1 potassium-transporting ATPase subunit C [Gordonia sp. X0973]
MKALIGGFLRQLVVAVVVLVSATVVLGLAYPAITWGISRITASKAEGSVLTDARGCPAGSALIGVDLRPAPGRPDGYLHSRVVGTADDPLAPGSPASSSSSNLGPNNPVLARAVAARRAAIAAREGVPPAQVPDDAVNGSASGLDPDISPDYARLQIPRISRATGIGTERVAAIIRANTRGRQWGFLGEPRVDVLRVNLALGHTVATCPGPPGH